MVKKRNIILITVDSLRADCLSCYSSNSLKTPNIDKLAEDGIMFRNAFSNGPNTVISVPSFLTSNLIAFINSSYPTVTTSLKTAGYNTIGLNPNVQLIYGYCKKLQLTKGFDIYDTMLSVTRQRLEAPIEALICDSASLLTKLLGRTNPILSVASNLICYAPIPIAVPAPRASDINKKLMSYLAGVVQPFFIWLFYLDSHEPYLPTQNYSCLADRVKLSGINRKLRYFGKNLSQDDVQRLFELYKKSVVSLDNEIGFLIKFLKEKGLYEDTIIFFTADHGEQFMEHGNVVHPAQLYNEQLHVPLIVKTGPESPKGLMVKETVSLLDLAPTMIKAADVEPNENFIGQILPFLNRYNKYKHTEKPVLAFADIEGKSFCYIKDNWKYIYCNSKKEKELYNLSEDPNEKTNLFKLNLIKAREFEEEAVRYLLEMQHIRDRTESEKLRIRQITSKLRNIR